MTRYDEPEAGDGKGGPHPLAGVPQEALDAATKALEEATSTFSALAHDSDGGSMTHFAVIDESDGYDEKGNEIEPDYDLEPVAHAILSAGLEAMRQGQVRQIETAAATNPCGEVGDPRCTCRDSNNEGPIRPEPTYGLHYRYCPVYAEADVAPVVQPETLRVRLNLARLRVEHWIRYHTANHEGKPEPRLACSYEDAPLYLSDLAVLAAETKET